MTMQPAATARGACSRETAAPAEKSAKSHCEKSKPLSSRTGWLRPRKLTLRPRERLLASGKSCATGKARSSSTLIIISPTKPVAPTTATANCLSIELHSSAKAPLRSGRRRGDIGSCGFHICVLRAVAQIVVHEHDGEHGLGDRRGAQADTRVVPPGGHDLHGVAGKIDGAARHLDAGGRLHRQVRNDVLARGNTAEHSAGVVAAEAARGELIAMLAAALRGAADPGAELHRLHRIDAHERMRDVRVEPIEHRLAEPRRYAAGDDRHPRTDRVALPAHLPDQILDLLDALRVGAEER